MDLNIQNKVALVTGASQGIGFAIAKHLIAEGVEVFLSSKNEANLMRAVETLQQSAPGSQITGVPIDMTSQSQIQEQIGKILDQKPIDILVNNSGGPPAGNSLQMSLEDWDRGYQEIIRSVILSTQLVVPKMRDKKWGRILNVTSTSAKEIIPKLPISGTFRAGLRAWTKDFAKEVGPWNILINNLLPGPTNTSRLQHLEKTSPEFFEHMKNESALKRIAEPDEIGRIGAFLCSNGNTFVTGTDILADGGITRSI